MERSRRVLYAPSPRLANGRQPVKHTGSGCYIHTGSKTLNIMNIQEARVSGTISNPKTLKP
eukprot:5992216-Pyramimonas_sp.AAC.1